MAMMQSKDTDRDESQLPKSRQRQALSQDLFHGLTPEEFNHEAKRLAELEALTPKVRANLNKSLGGPSLRHLATSATMPISTSSPTRRV